jgi:hypothetical protein
MAEKQVLGFKPAARLEQVGDKHSERVQDRKHRSQCCDDSALRCESRPDEIFGKDSRKNNLSGSTLIAEVRRSWRRRSTVADAASVLASGAALVMVGTSRSTIDPIVSLKTLLGIEDADTVGAGAFYQVHSHVFGFARAHRSLLRL